MIGGHYLTSWIRGTKYKITKHVVSEALGVPLVHRPTLPNTESPPFDDVMSLLCGRLVSWGSKLRINSSELCSRKSNPQAHRIITSSKVFLENECRTHMD